MMCYFLPLASGHKEYCTPEDSFWCCTGTGIENHSKYGDSIYFHQGKTVLFVNLFIASELRWPEAGLTLRQETEYPEAGRTRLVLNCKEPVALGLHIRHPYWAASGFGIKLNGARQEGGGEPGSYAVVERTWKSGDTLDVAMPFSLRTEGFADNPRRVAFLYGPLVLCAETDRHNEYPYPRMIAGQGELPAGLEPVSGHPCTFAASSQVLAPAEGNEHKVTLEPIHTMQGNREYVVYWNVFTPGQWQTNQAQSQALRNRLVDRVIPGDNQSESQHNLRGDKTGTDGKSWRHAVDGGWFSWDLNTLPEQPQELHVKYWGSDTGGREFDILADGERLVTLKLDNNKPGEFYEETYPIPDRVTRGKERITVRLQAHPGKVAGGVFGCAIFRRSLMAAPARVP